MNDDLLSAIWPLVVTTTASFGRKAAEIAIGVDGVVYYRYPNPRTARAFWPFDAPQYLLLNVAIGGSLGGAVDDTIVPVTMEIDHVKIWQAP